MEVPLQQKFKNHINDITNTIIYKIKELIKYNFTNHNETFYSWFMTNSDYDFVYIYEISFKQHFLENFTIETERILSYYSQNLVYAISTYYDIHRNLDYVNQFIDIFINKQFENIDEHQLFMEN
jgi:hypothetical protein